MDAVEATKIACRAGNWTTISRSSTLSCTYFVSFNGAVIRPSLVNNDLRRISKESLVVQMKVLTRYVWNTYRLGKTAHRTGKQWTPRKTYVSMDSESFKLHIYNSYHSVDEIKVSRPLNPYQKFWYTKRVRGGGARHDMSTFQSPIIFNFRSCWHNKAVIVVTHTLTTRTHTSGIR